MAETEVESILREIRERVLSQQRAGETAATRQMNGPGDSETLAEESLALINSYLTTTARAWDRLPPLVSNRSGLGARLELWLKRRLRTGTRWFTWEQVNFNAAAHHALRDLLQVLSAYEQELGKLRAKMNSEAEARQIEFEQRQNELATQRSEIEKLRLALEMQSLALETQSLAMEAHGIQVDSRLAGLAGELRERVERLQEEQRVCFKQLALESSEAAVLEDRARRKAEALSEELHRRIEQLEK